MKNIFKFLVVAVIVLSTALTSCTSVEPGHKGVKVEMGKTDLTQVYGEGMHWGVSWLYSDMIEYDVREHTLVKSFVFNDAKDMLVKVTVALDYNLIPGKVNILHTTITDIDTKIGASLSSAAKEVVPQYTAVELNKHKRVEGESILNNILKKELPEFNVEFKRIRITDVDIPKGISELAEQTAVQLGRNELASKKEAEQVALAKAKVAKANGSAAAKVAEAKGEYDAAVYQAKTRDKLSSPKMITLQRVENERIIAEGYKEHGKSIYGENNIFGSDAATVVKGLSFGK